MTKLEINENNVVKKILVFQFLNEKLSDHFCGHVVIFHSLGWCHGNIFRSYELSIQTYQENV